MSECQEGGCRHPATREWHGRRVCSDHYDIYKEQHERLTRDCH